MKAEKAEMKRLTEKTVGCFEYSLKDHKPAVGGFADYDTFFDYSMAVRQLGKLEDMLEPSPIDKWDEDIGPCLWWTFPIEEPPYSGSPLDTDFPSYVTHFTEIIMPWEVE